MHWRRIEKNDLEAVAGCRSRRSAGLAARTARHRPPVSACLPLRSPARLSGARTLGLGAAAQVALVARPDRSRSAAAAGQGELGKGRRADGRGQRGRRRGVAVPLLSARLHETTTPRDWFAANWEQPPAARNRCELGAAACSQETMRACFYFGGLIVAAFYWALGQICNI